MNHNPYNLKVGDKVILDASLHNSQVEIMEFNKNEKSVFVKIGLSKKPNEISWYETWEVMTNRLTPLENK